MFAQLKSLMSNHVAPSGSQVTFAPFSFALFARVEVLTGAKECEDIGAQLEDIVGLLDADELKRGREKLVDLVHRLNSQA
jgi:hypothetical protein